MYLSFWVEQEKINKQISCIEIFLLKTNKSFFFFFFFYFNNSKSYILVFKIKKQWGKKI